MRPVDFARWTTTLTASYLAITAVLIAILGNTVPGRTWLVAVHLTLSGLLLILNRARPSAGILRVIHDWHPLMLFPLLYKEVEVLAAVIGDWRLTAAIPAWESALFAGQPSLYLSERLAFVPLSEYLHFCYLSYVIVIPLVTAYWYVSGRRAAFGELLLMLSTVLLGSYLFFILLPVDSPYYLSQRLGPPLSGHLFFDLVHQMSARGGARGGAFPSAHVSGAVVVSLVAWRHQRRLAYPLVPLTGSVMIATVYGRFHYVLDALAGAALAIAVVVGYRHVFGDGPVRGSAPAQEGPEQAPTAKHVNCDRSPLGPDADNLYVLTSTQEHNMSRVLVIGSDSQVSREIGSALSAAGFPMEYSAGHADALHRLRMQSFGVVITSPDSTVEEDLALLEEMRAIRPGVKSIVLAPQSTRDEVIAALRARVFACFTPPFDPREIANLAGSAASDSQWRDDIQVLSAKPGWVSVRVNCRLITAERLMTFAKELSAQLPEDTRSEVMQALREILLNAMEHGAAFNPEHVVEVTGVRTGRALVFYVRDPGAGFRRDSLSHAAIANPADDPAAHIMRREAEGMRPGGYGLLLAGGTVDELIYSDIGNEVLLIKYLDSASEANRA